MVYTMGASAMGEDQQTTKIKGHRVSCILLNSAGNPSRGLVSLYEKAPCMPLSYCEAQEARFFKQNK